MTTLREIDFCPVVRVPGGYAVLDMSGATLIAYPNKKHAEQYALGEIKGLFNGAEDYDLRRTAVLRYLAARSTRVTAPVAQLELFA